VVVSREDSYDGGDVPDWDDNERRGSDEDAAWRDLVARFDAPAAVDQPTPWPDREDPDHKDPDREDPDRNDPDRADAGHEDANREPGDHHDPDRDNLGEGEGEGEGDPAPVTLFQTGTSTIGTPMVSSWRTSGQPAPDPEDEHFIPPTPPPLPQLQPLTKAAWLALFGGPAYLLIATAAGWSMPGIAVFCAIAAFVGGVALLVLRLNDSGSSSHDDDNDDGAVV
jgi:hypothetical protein